jgi:very-short-patch-repair endonuclease
MAKSRELNRKYCSNECGKIGLYKWYKNRPKHLSKFICELCGKKFENYKCSNFNKFCSVECFKEHNKRWRLSKTYKQIYGRKKSNEIKSKIAIKTAERNRTVVPMSKPHKMIKAEMIRQGLYDGFSSCQPLYYFEIDEFNPEKRVCIEIDGDYWHSLSKRIRQDKRKDTFLKNKGYRVIRIKEYDVYRNMNDCIKNVKKEIL